MSNLSKQLGQSADGALCRAMFKCDELKAALKNINDGGTLEDWMPKVRAVLAELNQRVHEFNAYENAANACDAMEKKPCQPR